MTRQESIDYIYLRAQECAYPENLLKQVKCALKEMDENNFNHLKRISEPAFRDWCKKLNNEVSHE